MEKYYIIREDGSSIFELPYPKDFCIHCLCLLIDDGQRYRLLDASMGILAGGEYFWSQKYYNRLPLTHHFVHTEPEGQ